MSPFSKTHEEFSRELVVFHTSAVVGIVFDVRAAVERPFEEARFEVALPGAWTRVIGEDAEAADEVRF